MTFVRRAMKKNRGVAVILAIFFMMLLSLIGVALIGIVPVELRSATRNKLDLQAHYAATSGIRHAKEWCSAVMTPVTASESTPNALGDPIGIGVGTSGNSFYPTGGAFHNDITGVNGTHADVEFQPMRFEDLWANAPMPHTARWTDAYQMLNIPSGGANTVHGKTVVLVKKTPLQLGENWAVYTVIIPDNNSPGGINTLDSSDGYLVKGSFGGTGQAGRRAYQIISLGYFQGYPTIRAKSTILEDSFARYSLFVDDDPDGTWALQATAGEITTQGPVHTNKFFRFALDSNIFGSGNTVVPFNGLMTHAENATDADVDANYVGKDGNRYYGGNDAIGLDEGKRPFNSAGAEIDNRYSKMVGGKGNLRRASKVSLPPDSTKIANAAYGTNYNTGFYGTGAVADHYKAGNEPDGIFVFPNGDGAAAGGIVVKNDQQRMFLEVVDSNGIPVVNQSQLESGSATGNPAIRVQAKNAATSTVAGTTHSITTTSWSTSSGMTSSSTGTSLSLTSGPTSSRTGSSLSSTFRTRTLSSTWWVTGTSYATVTLSGTSTITSSFPTSTASVRTSSGITTTGWTTIGGANGVVQPLTSTWTSYSTSWSTWTTSTTRLTSSSTGTSLSSRLTSTRTSSPTLTTSSWSTSTRYLSSTWTTTSTSTVTLYSSFMTTTSGSLTGVSTTVEGAESHVWNPIDQVIEAKNVGVNIHPTMFQRNISSGANYSRAAGAIGSANDMNVASLGAIQTMYQLNNGTLSAITGSLNVGTGNVVVIKQSRTNPKEAIVTVIPAVPDKEGKLLNGAVLTEGNIGDQRTGGLAGVNMGRKTIGGQIDANGTATEAAADATNLGPRPNKPSTYVGIGNNVWQFGTRLVETDSHQLRADNGLGLVAQDVRVNADPRDFSAWNGNGTIDFTTSTLLNLHMVILAGSSGESEASVNSGLTVKGFTTLNDLTAGNMDAGAGQTPVIRFMGGLILRNYYPRINGVNQAGWNSKNIYNQQLALVPPPYFPNNGQLVPLSYVEERIWGDQRF